jgi:carbamoyl-phosphate synthase large subunit
MKALRSLERKEAIFTWPSISENELSSLLQSMRIPTEYRLQQVQKAMWAGATIEQVYEATKIDRWYLRQIEIINQQALIISQPGDLSKELLRTAKTQGFSDAQIGKLRGVSEDEVRRARHHMDIRPVYKTVDTCAAEFEAFTPYHYSSYEEETEVRPRTTPAVIILGSGPNRIGQGIEFDYSCVHASFTLREAGFETIMVNCNPETVSTDYDTSNRLYFEPLTLEDVLEVVHAEMQAGPVLGVITQLGGQTPLGLAAGLKANGVTILGTSPDAINLAEERGAFGNILFVRK